MTAAHRLWSAIPAGSSVIAAHFRMPGVFADKLFAAARHGQQPWAAVARAKGKLDTSSRLPGLGDFVIFGHIG